MAFFKQATIPGFGSPVSYFRIDRIEIDETSREAHLYIRAYHNETVAKTPGSQGFHHSGQVDLRGEGFDAYFSRAALHDAAQKGIGTHAQGYRVIKDFALVQNGATDLTDSQKALARPGAILVRNDFRGVAFFADAKDS